MIRPSSSKRRLLILVLAILSFSLAFYAGNKQKHRSRAMPQIDGVLINPPLPLPPVNLLNQAGEAVSTAALEGHWSLLMLDPSPEAAPSLALTRLIQVHNRLATDPQLQQRIGFFYLPGDGDAQNAMSFSSMSDNIHALHGDSLAVDEVFEAFGAYADGQEHTLYLIGPNARVHALFTRHEDAATIANDLTTLIATMQ